MDIKNCEVERLGPHYAELDMAKKKEKKKMQWKVGNEIKVMLKINAFSRHKWHTLAVGRPRFEKARNLTQVTAMPDRESLV